MVRAYLDGARRILSDPKSIHKPNRTGVDTIELFGDMFCQYDLSKGDPVITTKRMPFKAPAHELIWFFRGETNIRYLVQNGVDIWTDNAFQRHLRKTGKEKDLPTYSPEWRAAREEYVERVKEDEEFAREHGDLGPVYPQQFRRCVTSDGRQYDQVMDIIDKLKNNPNSRRMVIAIWNVRDLGEMEIPPCHSFYQFNVRGKYLDCEMTQRSGDWFLGVPFNLMTTSYLMHILAGQADLKPGRFTHVVGSAHIYCGRGDRGKFYADNIDELKRRVMEAVEPQDLLSVRDWITKEAPAELEVEDESQSLDHVTALLEQMSRRPMPLPRIEVDKVPVDELSIDNFRIHGYQSHPAIKRAMAV